MKKEYEVHYEVKEEFVAIVLIDEDELRNWAGLEDHEPTYLADYHGFVHEKGLINNDDLATSIKREVELDMIIPFRER